MYWFFLPVLIVAVLIVISVAIISANARKRSIGRQPGQTVYDENTARRATDAPPA